jgi:hypothetical protein
MVSNLVSRIRRKTQTEGAWEQGAEGNIWAYEGGRNGRMKKNAQRGADPVLNK